MWRACNLTALIHSSTGSVVHPFASSHEGPGFNPQGGYLSETRILLLALSRYIGDPDIIYHCGLVWGGLHPVPSRSVTRSSCRQCDNPTWSHTALLSQFHACCGSSFRLRNRHSRLLGGSPVESLQSHCILTQLHWSSGPPVCSLSWGTRVQSPGILLLVLSRYRNII